jgi:hypothetical protein
VSEVGCRRSLRRGDLRDAQPAAHALPGATRQEWAGAMNGNDEQARRERRSALALQFHQEVITWSAEKLRRAYAQPEAVSAAEQYGTQAEAIEAARQMALRDGAERVILRQDGKIRERSSYGDKASRQRKG